MKSVFQGKTLKQLYGKLGGMVSVCNQCGGECEDYETSGYSCKFGFDYHGLSNAIGELKSKTKQPNTREVI